MEKVRQQAEEWANQILGDCEIGKKANSSSSPLHQIQILISQKHQSSRTKMIWSVKFGGPRTGHPELHAMLADYLYTESPELCYPGEDDLAMARAVLMYLSMGNLKDANFMMDEIKRQAETKNPELSESDLIEFASYLLETPVALIDFRF